ncbi:MAG: YktB family protein [Kurthia gibsonii]
MTNLTWANQDFDVFTIDGLEPRMDALKEQIRPKFEELGAIFSNYFTTQLGEEFFPHVAKHARRKTNPPNDSWVAFAPYKRGYKAMPHFQIGLFESHLFINLAVIYEAPNKVAIANHLLEHEDLITALPASFYISGDHMSPKTDEISVESAEKILTRFRDVKKGEVLIGVKVLRDDAIQLSEKELLALIEQTFETLLPIYRAMVNAPK